MQDVKLILDSVKCMSLPQETHHTYLGWNGDRDGHGEMLSKQFTSQKVFGARQQIYTSL